MRQCPCEGPTFLKHCAGGGKSCSCSALPEHFGHEMQTLGLYISDPHVLQLPWQGALTMVIRCQFHLWLTATGHNFSCHSNHLKIQYWSVTHGCGGRWPILGATRMLPTSSPLQVGRKGSSLKGRDCHSEAPATCSHVVSFLWFRTLPTQPPTPGDSRAPGWLGPVAVPIQRGPRPPLPLSCVHSLPSICCCNAPINFPFDILRAIYKSCRLSFVPSLMLGNKAAASRLPFQYSPNQVNHLSPLR